MGGAGLGVRLYLEMNNGETEFGNKILNHELVWVEVCLE